MPSPIVHSAAGYVVFRLSRRSVPEFRKKKVGQLSLLLIITLVFSMLPDVDVIAGMIAGDFREYHNNGTHSLVVGVLVAAVFGLALSWNRRTEFLSWFLIILISYSSHILLDFFTWGGRGVMLFWPFTSERFQSGLALFYGVRWGNGLISVSHLWTLATETVFVLFLLLFVNLVEHRTYRVTSRENV